MSRTTLLSPLPWTWRPYDDGAPFLALCDARENELGYVWVAIEDPDNCTPVGFVLRTRAELERNLAAIVAVVNNTDAEPPATPRPWRVVPGRGWKDERVLSIVGERGLLDEVVCRNLDHQTEIDFAAICARVNTRWPA